MLNENEKGLPHANEKCPEETAKAPVDLIIAQTDKNVKCNLKDLTDEKKIPRAEIVATVCKLHPKFDKYLLSKCEQVDKYGIELCEDGMNAVLERFAPELLSAPASEVKEEAGDNTEKPKPGRKSGGHRLHKEIRCRLEDDEHERLMQKIKSDGFDTIQAWLTFVVRNYLKGANGNG